MSLEKMDSNLESEEAKYINLYNSDYIRESIDSIAARRENKKAGCTAERNNGELPY